MLHTKPGIALGYFVSGGTFGTGAVQTAKEKVLLTADIKPTLYILGLTLSEIALLIGIAGTCATMLFQYLNYRNNKKVRDKELERLKKLAATNDTSTSE